MRTVECAILLNRRILTELVGLKSDGMRTTSYERQEETVPECRIRVPGTRLKSRSLTSCLSESVVLTATVSYLSRRLNVTP